MFRRNPAHLLYGFHPPMATKTSQKKIPLESARAGAEDDSSVDNTVTDPGTEQTTRKMISTSLDSRAGAKIKLQTCSCGWTKVTTSAGLKIHQGRKKCLKEVGRVTRIDHYFLRSKSSQSSEVQQRDENQSLPDITNPIPEEDVELYEAETNQPSYQPAIEKAEGRKPSVKWPGSCEKKEWEKINQDLSSLLEQLKGTAIRKLERMGDLIYNYGAQHFGVGGKKEKTLPTPKRSRRQQEIDCLIKDRRQLKKLWRKADDEEREGIEVLQGELKNRLAALRRAENLRMKRRKKERARSTFFKDPFAFVKTLFTKEKGGKLAATKKDLEAHLSEIHSDRQRWEQRILPPDMPPIPAPQHHIDTNPPRWSEVQFVVQRARAASAPGPNGVPYRLYKNAPDVLRWLWRLMKVVWQKQLIPTSWRRAGGVLIPKEKDSVGITQFRNISLLNVEGKMFFSVLAHRLTTYLKKNNYIDTSIQKAGVPGFSGCLEHASMIWHQIQRTKKDGKDLHVVFLDLANAFGSVPHSLLWSAFAYFNVPEPITTLVKAYFLDIQLCITTEEYTTAWQRLEMGIMAGCTISPLAFTMAMEVIIRASQWVVGGQRTKPDLQLPPIRAFMDDITTLTTTKACTKRLLNKLQQNIDWARLKLKPSKCRSISIIKGKLSESRFYIGEEPIPTVAEKPIKSLGRWYDSTLKDGDQVNQIRQYTIDALKTIEKSLLPGKLKLWCLQYGLLPRLQWPLTVYEIPLSKVEKLESIVGSFVKRWLGLPRCLSKTGLYGRGLLELPVSSLSEEFKCSKVRLEMTLRESLDPCVAKTTPTLVTGRKWVPAIAAQQARSALHHQEIVGHVQHGRGGLGLGQHKPAWSKATPSERRGLVVEEVRRQEQAMRCAAAVSQAKQGQWMRWEGVERRKLSWKDLWNMEAYRASFLIRATYDVLPSPANLHQWYGKDPTCSLCPSPANLKHIMVGCKTSLAQGRYTWRHNQVLKVLAAILESKRMAINKLPSLTSHSARVLEFVSAGTKGGKPASSKPSTGQLSGARDWKLWVDLGTRLGFPADILETNLRPDLVLWSSSVHTLYIVELTVPWEDAVEEAYERKHLRYSELAASCEQRGWKTRVCPVEVGCRGFVGKSTTRLLKDMGVRGQAQRQAIKNLSSAAEQASRWLWIKRQDSNWATNGGSVEGTC